MSVITDTEDEESEGEFDSEPIGDMSRAEYVLSRVAYFANRQEEIKEVHRKEQERLDEWAYEENRKIEARRAHYEDQLLLFHRAVFASDESRKTISLPSGKLVTKPGKAKVEVIDLDEFVQKAPREVVRTKYEVDKAAVREHIETTGEAVPGVKLIPAERTFEVKV